MIARLQKNSTQLLILIVLFVKGYFLFLVYTNGNFNKEEVYVENLCCDVKGDGHHNQIIAKNLFDHHVYSDNNSNIPSEFSVWRPPVWPFILSIFFFISNNLFSILVLKVLLETLLIVILYKRLIKKGIVKRYYLLFLLLIEPQFLKYSITFFSESITAILILSLFYLFLLLDKKKRINILIPIISAITILCHPVSVFSVLLFMGLYVLYAIKKNIKHTLLHIGLFIALMLAWPIRNEIVFQKGLFITASQGAAISKGWNEKIATDFNNVQGDLANPNLNLEYINQSMLNIASESTIDQSKIYKEATISFIKEQSFVQLLEIAFVKVKSNFNPFPEKSKPGGLEFLGIFFRILYLIIFVQSILFLLKNKKMFLDSEKGRIAMFVICLLIGQVVMAITIYSGLRFNTIYSLSLLSALVLFNKERFKNIFYIKRSIF